MLFFQRVAISADEIIFSAKLSQFFSRSVSIRTFFCLWKPLPQKCISKMYNSSNATKSTDPLICRTHEYFRKKIIKWETPLSPFRTQDLRRIYNFQRSLAPYCWHILISGWLIFFTHKHISFLFSGVCLLTAIRSFTKQNRTKKTEKKKKN